MSQQEIGQLAVVLSAQTASFDKGMASAIKSIQKMDETVKANAQTMNKVSAQFKSVGEAATLLARAFAVLGGAGYIKGLLDQADAASDLADAFGLTVANVYAYQTALLSAGGKADGFDKVMQKISSNVTDAFNGVKSARDGFDQLGISLQSIQSKNVGEIFDVIATKLAKIEDPAKRNAVAMDILGKSAIGIDWTKYGSTIDETKKAYGKLEPSIQAAADASERFELMTKKVGVALTALAGDLLGGGLFEKLKRGFTDLIEIAKGNLTAADAILLEEMEKLEKQTLKLGGAVVTTKREIKSLVGTTDPFTSWKESLAKSTVEAELFTRKMEYLDAQMKKATATEQIKAIQTEMEKLNGGKSPFESWKDGVDKLSQSFAMIVPQLEYLAELRNLDMMSVEEYVKQVEALGFGASKASDDMTKLGDSIAQSIGQNANNAVNNFIDNIGEAKFSFSDFATSVIKDLAKMMVQMMIMQPLIKSFQGFMGGMMAPTPAGGSSSAGASTYSLAPVTGIDSRALSGEATATTFGASIAAITRSNINNQVKMMGSLASNYQARPKASSSETPLVVNITNEMGDTAKVTAAESTNADGVKTLSIMIQKEVKEMFGSGAMDKSMRSSYGLNRAAV